MGKTQKDRGFYPISMTDVKRYLKNCEQWDYSDKESCKYVAENIIEQIEINHDELPIIDTLYGDLISIVNNINNGATYSRINISYKH
jgi:hypothetical protein